MLLSALTNLYQNKKEVNTFLNKICTVSHDLYGIKARYEIITSVNKGIKGYILNYHIERDFQKDHVNQFKEKWLIILKGINLEQNLVKKIFMTIDKLILIEQNVHGVEDNSLEAMHFHELNSIDTIIDFTTVFWILNEKNKEKKVYGLPTCTGTGRTVFSHGSFNLPVPAVSLLLEKSSYPLISLDYPFELTTPSGLTLLSSIVSETMEKLPSCKIITSGIGLGQRRIKGLINFLRIWKINPKSALETLNENQDQIMVLETHVDDVSGENLGYIFEYFDQIQGVHDIAIYPLIMKKNRPGHCIRILYDPDFVDSDQISIQLMKITGTLGVRMYPTNRHKTVREIKMMQITIKGTLFTCAIKIAKINSQIIQMKPEFEDIKIIAKETGLSIIEIQQDVIEKTKKILLANDDENG